MAEKARELADTYFVRRRLFDPPAIDGDVVELPAKQSYRINFPSGRVVKALDRKLFEEALRAATLKK